MVDARSSADRSLHARLRQQWLPGSDVLRRIRFVMLFFVPASVVPWFMKAEPAHPATVGSGVLLAIAGVGWLWTYRRDATPPLLLDLLHGPLALGLLLSAPPVQPAPPIAEGALFSMAMLLQVYGGPLWRFVLRSTLLLAAYVGLAMATNTSVSVSVIGLVAAGLFSYLLALALEEQRRSLGRARALAQATKHVAASPSYDEVLVRVRAAVAQLAQVRGGTVVISPPEALAEFSGETSTPVFDPRHGRLSVQVAGPGVFRGVLSVDLDAPPKEELQFELRLLLSVAVQTCARLDASRAESELAIAAQLQSSLLPRSLYAHGFRVAGTMTPVAEIGGDSYDFLEATDGCFVAIGDVAGHGLSSGLVMLLTQGVSSALVQDAGARTPRELVTSLNRVLFDTLHRRLKRTEHITFTLLRFQNSGLVTYAGAHEDILVRRSKTRTLDCLPTPGTWIAASPDVSAATIDSTFRLERGDLVLLHTDGVTTAKNEQGERFGLERLSAAFEAAPKGSSADAVLRHLAQVVREWSPKPNDDWSLVVVEFVGDG